VDPEVFRRSTSVKPFIACISPRRLKASDEPVGDEIGELREKLIENNSSGRTTADVIRSRRATTDEPDLGGWRHLRTGVRLHCRDLP
jgi:hypothetical protein